MNDHVSRIPNVESRPVADLDENGAIEPSEHPDRRILRDTIRNVADGQDEPLLVSEGRPRIVGWDERAVLDLSLEEARRELTETAAAATWFPDVRRVTRGDVVEVVLGREEPIHLAVVSEAWTPDLDGVVFEASCGAFSMSGSLSVRTVVAGTEASGLKTSVEVLVRVETIDVPEARRALARAQLITHDGLARMAARLNPR